MVVGEDREAEPNPRTKTCVVLGGRGFIGRSLVARLLKLGNWIVRVADSAQSLHLDSTESDSLLFHALSSRRASYHHVDTRDKSLIVNAIEGSSVVFYFDDADIHGDDFYLCYVTIVQGAKNVVVACLECKVRRLIYNSCANVVFDGLHDIINGDEFLPYPWKFQQILDELKAQAETIVLFANNSIEGLLTCAIRPCNVFGPGDPHIVPFLVRLARSSWAKYIIGSGENISDFIYVENVSHAHICAEESLGFQRPSVAGKAFFISNLEPIMFRDFSLFILEELGYQRSPVVKLPARIRWQIHSVIKCALRKWGFVLFSSSAFRYIQITLFSRTISCIEAQNHIGYAPVVSLKEGLSLTTRSFSHISNNNYFLNYCNRDEPSKVEKHLGSGNVAGILLWRDEKTSFACFIVFVMMFIWFFLSGGTFASSTTQLALLGLCFLFGYSVLPPNVFGFPVKKVSSSYFEIPEAAVKESVAQIAHTWNRGFYCIRSLAEEQDWKLLFKVMAFLYFVKIALSFSVPIIIGLAVVFPFTSFFVYEQYESEIDGVAKLLFDCVEYLARLLKRNLPHYVASALYNNRVLQGDENLSVVNHWK